jgi:tRNA(fMet)-specific endonuclease VapC
VPALVNRLERTPVSSLILSPVVLGELEVGAEKSAFPEKNRTRLSRLVDVIPFGALDADTSVHYGRIRADLERKGTPIGANDLWIAAQAMALGAALVTDNTREFARVEGLVMENWLR